MPELKDPDIAGARLALKAILEALNVTRVVCVDDIYEDQASVEDFVVAASSLEPSILADLLPELENVSDDKDILKDQLRRLWLQLDVEIRVGRAEKVLAAARLQDTSETDDDPGDASILNELVPTGMLVTLTPKQWEERRQTLVEQDRQNRTLFLFDQDLRGKGGDEQGGIKIIAALLADNANAKMICGLLTHTITPSAQLRRWKELSSAYDIPADRFLVVPKQFSQDPLLLAQNLKLLALSPDFVELKKKTKQLIEDASAAAASRIDEISIYDLDYMIFQIAGTEGMWEPDMLFRLHALFHRLESRRLAHIGGELETIAGRLRAVSQIPTPTKVSPESSTWKIQQEELYEPGDYLNQNHLPIEVGDIFERTDADSNKRYILLAQPCDLMVRKNGKRSPDIARVPVAEVVRRSANDRPKQSIELAYFGNANEHWYVNLKQVHQVRVCVLDLCVFNEDGVAKIQPDAAVANKIRPAWKARYKDLAKLFRKRLTRLALLTQKQGDSADISTLKQQLRTELGSELLREEPFRGSLAQIDGKTGIVFDCRRIGRLFGAQAYGLLMDYTSCIGRMAYDREFGQTPPL